MGVGSKMRERLRSSSISKAEIDFCDKTFRDTPLINPCDSSRQLGGGAPCSEGIEGLILWQVA